MVPKKSPCSIYTPTDSPSIVIRLGFLKRHSGVGFDPNFSIGIRIKVMVAINLCRPHMCYDGPHDF